MSNPILRENIISRNLNNDSLTGSNVMSVSGTLTKTCILGLLVALTFSYTWYLVMSGFADKAQGLMMTGLIGGFITSLIICFGPKNKFLAFSTSIYAMFEGLFLGAFSAVVNKYYPGIAPQAAMGTIFAVFGMYFLYSSKVIKCTDNFRKIVLISTFSVFAIYLIQWILSIFNIWIPGIFSNGPVGIAFSLIVVAVAAFNLIMDFDFWERADGKLPAYFEWFGAFSLMVTIVWLYIEIVRLLMKINSRN